MASHEEVVRDAAIALNEAIGAAVRAGYVVVWPTRLSDLSGIAVSETGKVSDLAQPLDMTDAESATLPRLNPSARDNPADRIAVSGKTTRKS